MGEKDQELTEDVPEPDESESSVTNKKQQLTII